MSETVPLLVPAVEDSVDVAKMAEKKSIEELRKQFTVKGVSGLINIGNTCYMNSMLQCLAATDIFVSYLRGSGTNNPEFKNDLKQNILKSIVEKIKKDNPDVDNDKLITKDAYLEIRKRFKKSLTYKLRTLLVIMWGINCEIKPFEFKKKLGKLINTFNGSLQNDSQESLSFVLDTVHEETKTDVITELKNLPYDIITFKEIKDHYTNKINDENLTDEQKIMLKEEFDNYKREHPKEDATLKCLQYWQKFLKKNHSAITDIFMGLFFFQIKCTKCNNFSFSYEPYHLIPLSIPESNTTITLNQCLKENFNVEELLTNDNKYDCSVCQGKQDAIKKQSIWHSPPRLIIMLKRYSHSKIFNKSYKNNVCVKFPLTDFDISESISEYTSNDSIYDLYGVIYQMGGLGGGHYIAYTMNPINNEWYKYDDNKILHINRDKIEDLMVDSGAYTLFYKKRGNVNITTMSDDDDLIDML